MTRLRFGVEVGVTKARRREGVLVTMVMFWFIFFFKKFKIKNFFKAIKGAQDTLAKGKIDYGRELFAAENLYPDSTILIGDTLHDKEVADSLKIKCVLYSGGHQTYNRLAINNSIVVSDLLKSFDVVEKLL